MLYGSIFLLIGGGSQMVVAMISTVVADVVPVSERTGTFYQIYAMNLVISIAVNPLAAFLLSIDPWLAMWIGNAVLTIGVLSSALIPETLKFRQAADNKRRGQDGSSAAQQESQLPSKQFPSARELAQRAWFSAKNDVSHVWRFIFTSKTVVLLLLAYGPFYLIKLTFVLDILQYMTRRFNWEWSTVRRGPFLIHHLQVLTPRSIGNIRQHSQQSGRSLHLAGAAATLLVCSDQTIPL
jgi:hypothetical protein